MDADSSRAECGPTAGRLRAECGTVQYRPRGIIAHTASSLATGLMDYEISSPIVMDEAPFPWELFSSGPG